MNENFCKTCSDFQAGGNGTGGYCDTPDGLGDEQKRGEWIPNNHSCSKHFTGLRCRKCGYCSYVGNLGFISLKCNNINSPKYGKSTKDNGTCNFGETDIDIKRRKQIMKANNDELNFDIQLRPLIDDARFK